MVAFEVLVNGRRRYVAGHPDAQTLSIWVRGAFPGLTAVPAFLGMHGVVGLPSPSAGEGQLETLTYPGDQLAIGDEVTIRIIEVDRADPPSKQSASILGSRMRGRSG